MAKAPSATAPRAKAPIAIALKATAPIELIPIIGMSILAVVVAKAQDLAKVDPQHCKVLLDNEYVRILEIHMKPGDKSPMHSRPHHAVYTLAGSTLNFTSPDGKTKTVTINPGQAVWRNAETHTVEIAGKTDSHALDIDFCRLTTERGINIFRNLLLSISLLE